MSALPLLSTESGPRGLVGRVEPRLWVPPARELTPETSFGFAVAEFARDVLGEPLLPWQEWLVIHAGELLPDGRPRFRTVLVLVARQNGKTHLCVVLSLFWLFVDRVPFVLGTSTNLDYARESWEKAVVTAQSTPDLAPLIPRNGIKTGNGKEGMTTTDRCRYKIATASESGGRSLTVHRLILDELRQHKSWAAWGASTKAQMAVPDAQAWALSNAGDATSVVLNDLRGKAIAAIDTGEYPEQPIGLFEYSADDECDLDDRDAWAQANPALGHTVTESAITAALTTDDPATFRTEVLCQRVDVLGEIAVQPADWTGCRDEQMRLAGLPLAVVVDIAPDMLHATLVAAGLGHDGRVRVRPAAAWQGPGAARQLVREMPAKLAEVAPKIRGYFPAGPAAALKVDLEKLGFQAIPQGDTTPACQGLAAQILGRQIVHDGDQLLTAHITGAKKWAVGDGWRFVRKGAGHVDAAYATAGAVHLARTLPPPRRAVVLVGRARTV